MVNKDRLKAKRKFTMWEDWRGNSTEDYAIKKSMNRYTRRTSKSNLKNISKYL